jgi:hypothetical protein
VTSLVFSDANGFDGTISLVGSTATLTITTALTTGSVPFIGASGALSQDNANLFFDDTNNRLGINTNSPTTAFDVFGSGIIGRINGTSTNNAFLGFASADTNKWSVGNVQSDHRFRIYNEATTSELVSVLQTGEFGIGIANPTTKLHIDGGASALIANLDADISIAKSISFRSDNSNRINLEVSGTESGSDAGADLFIRTYTDAGALLDTALFIKRSTGNIGIGETNPTSSQADRIFALKGSYPGIILESTGVSKKWSINANWGASVAFLDFYDETIGASRMRINTSGYVGINSTSPISQLSVKGAGGSTGVTLTLENGGGVNALNDPLGIIDFYSNDPSGGASGVYGRIAVRNEFNGSWDGTPAREDTYMDFSTSVDGTMYEGMRLDSNGRLGIGSASVGSKLYTYLTADGTHYRGRTIDGSNNPYLDIKSSGGTIFFDANGSAYGQMAFKCGDIEILRLTSDRHFKLSSTSAAGTNLDMYLLENDGLYFNSNEGATGRAIYFQTGGTTRATITSAGAIYINTNTALPGSGTLLHVNSADAGPTFKNSSSGQQSLMLWSAVSSGDNLLLEFNVNTSIAGKGSIDYNRASNVIRYNTTSDANLKNIIGDSDKQKSIDILNSTRIREYSWKEDETNKPQIGVIAQELYQTFKGAVSVGSNEELLGTEEYKNWGVDKTAFTFHLIAGWQKHQEIIANLEARIKQLESK